MEVAYKQLYKQKAIGVDGLADYIIKNKNVWAAIRTKLQNIFENWINGSTQPNYLYTARITALTKDKS